MIGWLRKTKRQTTTTHEARQAVERVRREKPEVDALVTELRERRIQNKFAPTLEVALGVTDRRQQ